MKYPVEYEKPFSFSPIMRAFAVPYQGVNLNVIASEHPNGWGHLSVSLDDRCPTWKEMCAVKNTFFDDEEICIQLHPKKSDYLNIHNFCLHIWQPPEEIAKLIQGCSDD